MIVGLGEAGSVAHVTSSGAVVKNKAGKTTKIVLPPMEIKGRVPAPKKAAAAVSSPAVAAAPALKFPISPRTSLMVAGGALLLWWAAGQGYLKALGIGRGRRTARNPRRSRRRRRGGRYAKNPGRPVRSFDPDVQKAIKFRKDFHWGYGAKAVSTRSLSPTPRTLVQLGKLQAVTYNTKKKGERANFFVHDFEGSQPILAMDIRNKKLHIIGGSYTVTDDGITG